MVKKILLLLFFSVFTILNITNASHLIGGDITYTYVGKWGQDFRYNIKVTLYRDCFSSSVPGGQPTPFDDEINLGFYEDIGNREIKRSLRLYLNSPDVPVDPPSGGSDCSFKPKTCIRQGTYEGVITLPSSDHGYYIQYIRCCRNTLVNVKDSIGTTFTGFIPKTNITNNTPVFTAPPAPYICADDTVTYLNSASDPDGDVLVYELVHPYSGADAINPVPNLPNKYSFPGLVPYRSGTQNYNSSQPFGKDGYVKIDPVTGHTVLYSKTVGRFAIAYDVHEYRNGQKISTVRRDVQIIVIPSCPKNYPPVALKPGTNTKLPVDYTITAGEVLQFDIEVNDPTDIVYLSSSGDILNPNSSIPKPIATLPNAGGSKNFKSTFRWDTDCIHARALPYYFTLTLTDKGCPPKSSNTPISINVVPFKGTDKLNGPVVICSGVNAAYSTTGSAGSSYIWKVEGGEITSSDVSSNSVSIKWFKGTTGRIKLVERSKDGCNGDTVYKNIQILPYPETPVITGSQNVCIKENNNYKLIKTTPGASYWWSVKGGQQIQGGNSASISVQWDTTEDTAVIMVTEKNKEGCFGDTAVMKVVKSIPKANKILGTVSVCPNAKGIDYWVDPAQNISGSSFSWFVEGGKIIFGTKDHSIRVDWGNKGWGKVKMLEITKYGCVGDTITLDVMIDYNLITPPIEGDTSLCEFTKGEVYKVPFTNNSTFSWQISGGTIISGNGTHSIVVDWEKAGKGMLSVIETAHDSINNLPCIGKPVVMFIALYPIPLKPVISGITVICEKDSALYNVSGFTGSKFIWSVSSDALILKNDSGAQLKVYYPKAGTYTIGVFELSKDSCAGVKTEINITVNPRPKTSQISGTSKICAPNLNGHIYSVSGSPGSTYFWELKGGEIIAGAGTSQITVNWKIPGIDSIAVTEGNIYDCKGEKMRMVVYVDSSALKINRVSTLVADDGQIELDWSLKNNLFLRRMFQIYRQVVGGQWSLIDSVPYTQYSYIDKNVNTDKFSYRYRIEAPNICGYNVVSAPHRSILLQGFKKNDSTMNIFWNRYEGWPEGVGNYSVYRKNNRETDFTYYTKLQDTSMLVEAGLENYLQCFRITGEKAGDGNVSSWSNEYCFIFDPILWVPNVFSPNGDILNDRFNVLVSFYRNYDIKIFNRWGERIFHSNDPKDSWDGTYRGKRVEDGVFLYMIRVEGMHSSINKSGTLHVLRY